MDSRPIFIRRGKGKARWASTWWCPAVTALAAFLGALTGLRWWKANVEAPLPVDAPQVDSSRLTLDDHAASQAISCIHTGDSVSGMFDVKKAGVLLA